MRRVTVLAATRAGVTTPKKPSALSDYALQENRRGEKYLVNNNKQQRSVRENNALEKQSLII